MKVGWTMVGLGILSCIVEQANVVYSANLSELAMTFIWWLPVTGWLLYSGINKTGASVTSKKLPWWSYIPPIIIGMYGGVITGIILRKRDKAAWLAIIGLLSSAISWVFWFTLSGR